MPTWTAQGDLLFSIFSGHGEFPKVVLAPGDHKESFEFSWRALNLAADLQTPIIVLSDKFLAESSATLSPLDKEKIKVVLGKIQKNPSSNFKRYNWRPRCGRSYRTIPGTKNGEFLTNSYEHDQAGFSTEDSQIATKMAQKRMRKLRTALRLAPKPKFFGNPQNLIISFGSTKGSILEAIRLNKKWGFLQIRTLWPLHQEIGRQLRRAKKIVLIENNQIGQLEILLKTKFSLRPDKKILKFDGRPFFPEEISNELDKI
jgi:2-oxoglutarate ferredoxin oxidoreductase subunit alpha